MSNLTKNLLVSLALLVIRAECALAQAAGGGSGKDPATAVINQLKTSTKGLSSAFTDGTAVIFGIIGGVLFLYGFVVAIIGDNRLKGVWFIIGSLLCLTISTVVGVFLTAST
jgi:hypothetical protein